MRSEALAFFMGRKKMVGKNKTRPDASPECDSVDTSIVLDGRVRPK